LNSSLASRGALIDIGLADGDGVGIIMTAGIAATRALRLRQNGVNGFG
jgi:hypothetical protein